MKLYCTLIDPTGNVSTKATIEATADWNILAHLLSFQLSGETAIVQEVKDVFDVHKLHNLDVKDALAKIVELAEDDDAAVEELDLYGIAEDVAEWADGVILLLDGDVGTDFYAVTEQQTTLMVRLA